LLAGPPPELVLPELKLLETLSPLLEVELEASDFFSRPRPVSPMIVSRTP
jgi:hypothetical protein